MKYVVTDTKMTVALFDSKGKQVWKDQLVFTAINFDYFEKHVFMRNFYAFIPYERDVENLHAEAFQLNYRYGSIVKFDRSIPEYVTFVPWGVDSVPPTPNLFETVKKMRPVRSSKVVRSAIFDPVLYHYWEANPENLIIYY